MTASSTAQITAIIALMMAAYSGYNGDIDTMRHSMIVFSIFATGNLIMRHMSGR